MTERNSNLPAVGTRIGDYEIIEGDFCGQLPLGVIVSGPNKGVKVIMNSFKVKGVAR